MNMRYFFILLVAALQPGSVSASCIQSIPCAVKVINQSDIPYTIRVPGKYVLGQRISLYYPTDCNNGYRSMRNRSLW